MKKILGLIASPRKLGNSELMVKEIGRQIGEPHNLKLLRFSDFNIKPCIGCYKCMFGEKRCIHNDDFYEILEAIVEADALILASPTYFLGANALLKLFLDRGIAFYPFIDQLWGKPSVGFGIAGINGKEGSTLLGIENFLKLMLSEIKMKTIVYGALPGEVFFNEENRKKAGELASALFSTSQEKAPYACNLCGGETFRFLGSDRVQCMLCSNKGLMKMEKNQPKVNIEKGMHDLFISHKDVMEHEQWLLGMKDNFIKNKKRLKEICLDYRGGEWIKPEKKQKSE
ncbi:flavodoxin family protein [Desulfobacterales bacterium HSG16]|nr:flavodoxin family protein [Desulfobacterales bacterium HSG16]